MHAQHSCKCFWRFWGCSYRCFSFVEILLDHKSNKTSAVCFHLYVCSTFRVTLQGNVSPSQAYHTCLPTKGSGSISTQKRRVGSSPTTGTIPDCVQQQIRSLETLFDSKTDT